MGDAQGSAMEINHPPMNTHETQKILVVDSRDNLREKVCQLILSRGFEVAHFKSPEEAIASIETRSPFSYALILSGYRMPVMTGDEFLKKAGTILPGTHRILLTDSEDIYSIINTVNAAEIHSCMTRSSSF
jgi:DNA-binding NtrC family response regulator